jgi:renalase
LEANELKKIAVIGAGIAGIVCARTLVQAGHRVQVFEKSRGFGGRMATRKTPMGTFDHGAPYFEVSDPRFKKALAVCPDVTAIWKGLAKATIATPTIATPTMSALVGEWAKPLLEANGLESQGCSVALDTLVTGFQRDLGDASKWQIQSTKEGIEQPTLGGFDAIVLAIPNVQASALLEKAEQTHLQQITQTAQMSPCWAMMLVYEGELSKQDKKLVKDFNGKRYKDSTVAWIGRELSKQSRTGPERFVVHASPEWSQQHLEADEAFVLTELLAEFAKLTGIHAPPSSNRAHRWRYAHVAKPVQTANTQSFVWDSKSAIGMCGDWCSGNSVQDAFVSGLELALHIVKRESFPTITTERLMLRELLATDAPALLSIHGDANYMRWFGSDPITDVAQAENLIKNFAGWREHANPGVRWAIERKSDQKLVGTCGLFKWNRNWRSCSTGYELSREAAGQGYMAEALKAIFSWGFENMKLNRIEATVSPENTPSINTLTRANFVREGFQREAGYWGKQSRNFYGYALLRADHLGVRFVPAQISDLEQLVQIRTVAMRPSLEAVGRFDADRVRQRLINNYFPEHTQLIYLVDKVIGFYTLRPVDGQLLLDHLYIDPNSQGLGVGGITLNRMFAMASNESKTIRVGALIGSDSNRFYTENGFVLVSSSEFDHYYERSWF